MTNLLANEAELIKKIAKIEVRMTKEQFSFGRVNRNCVGNKPLYTVEPLQI